jgi:hypothetical protein
MKAKGVFLGAAQNRVFIDEKIQSMSWVEAIYANHEQLENIEISENFEIYGCSQN